MGKNVLITGISGFAGSHLAEYLTNQENCHITGTYLEGKSLENLPSVKNTADLVKIDLTNEKQVFNLVADAKPDIIFHLAAQSSTADSFKNPKDTIVNNVVAQINMLEAVRSAKIPQARILIVSSADVYGRVPLKDLPIDEETNFVPMNPYAVSKIAQDFLGLQYFLSYNIHIVRVRPFNHIGPRQSPNFVIAAFAKKIAEIEKGQCEPVLYVGNLEAKRDFTDVRDMVKAYVDIIEKGEAGNVYNIGSGTAYKIAEMLDRLLAFAKVKIAVKLDKDLFRPSDTEELLCDNTKIQKTTAWKPTISLEKSLQDTLDYWRNIV